MTRHGVLDVGYAAPDVCFEGGVFESAVAGGIKGAVFQYQIVGVAKWLLAADVAVDQTQVAGVPAEIFAVKLRVVDSYVLNFPEGVFRGDSGIMYLCVFDVLEDVFA